MTRQRIRRVTESYHYFFVRPNSKENVHATAEKLMEIKSVTEVAITEGHFGFVVKAEDNAKVTADRINKATRGTSSMAICHCQYAK